MFHVKQLQERQVLKMFINISFWKYDSEERELVSSERTINIHTFEELENDLIIYLENETNVYRLEFLEDLQVIELWLKENKRLVEYYISLDEATEEEKSKIKKLVLDYYREVMI